MDIVHSIILADEIIAPLKPDFWFLIQFDQAKVKTKKKAGTSRP